jgi:hypothetical protein
LEKKKPSPLRRLAQILGWTRSSYFLMSVFIATIFLIAIVWWPIVADYIEWYNPDYPLWMQIDWLLLGIFAAMSLLIMAGANITRERPPLWIIPAWPIASLSIERMVRMLERIISERNWVERTMKWAYWIVFPAFMGLMLYFVWPTVDKSLTVMALILCTFLVLTPTNYRTAFLNFAAGSGLGYFLELWGTTRRCWTYYTFETPPLFAVLAHGMAAVAFWRVADLVQVFRPHLMRLLVRVQTR